MDEAAYKRQLRAADEAVYQANQQAILAQAAQTDIQTRLNAVTGDLNVVVGAAADLYGDDPASIPPGPLLDKLREIDPDRFL